MAGALEVDKVLLAIEELRRWEKRREELARNEAGKVTTEELARVRQQITYYDGLLQDMKRRAHPASMPRFINQVSRDH